jgi:hypothetical protein
MNIEMDLMDLAQSSGGLRESFHPSACGCCCASLAMGDDEKKKRKKEKKEKKRKKEKEEAPPSVPSAASVSSKKAKAKAETAPEPAVPVPEGLAAELQSLLASSQAELDAVDDDAAMRLLEAEHTAGRADGEISDFSEDEEGLWAAGGEGSDSDDGEDAEDGEGKEEKAGAAGSDAATSATAADADDKEGSTGVTAAVPEGGKPGDWVCPRCSAHCYASRTSCYKCSAPHPGGMAGLLKDSAAYLLSGAKEEPSKRGTKRAAPAPAAGADAGPQIRASGFAARADQSCSIFINGLPYTATKQDIATHFKDCCDVEEMAVRIVFDKTTRRSKGVAFIDMPNAAAMDAACGLHQSTFTAEDGSSRPINVRPVSHPPTRSLQRATHQQHSWII